MDQKFSSFILSTRRHEKVMGQTIGTIIFVIIALVVVATVGSLILSVLGLLFGLIPLLIKLAIWGGLIYLGWLLIRKLTRTTAD
jgi:hypothetical protein